MRIMMNKLIASVALATVFMAITQAGAATYTYTGVYSPGNDGNNYYASAAVDLSCAGPCSSGIYTEGGTLTSFTLSIDGPSPSNAPVFSISSSDLNYISSADPTLFGFPSYLTLSNVGGVITITNWSVFADTTGDPALNFAIYTIGNDPINFTQDYYADGSISSGTLNANPGVWTGPGITSATATPLPAALPLFAGGLGVMGLLARRRKRKNTAAIAAA
jgi:hypothetical protein